MIDNTHYPTIHILQYSTMLNIINYILQYENSASFSLSHINHLLGGPLLSPWLTERRIRRLSQKGI